MYAYRYVMSNIITDLCPQEGPEGKVYGADLGKFMDGRWLIRETPTMTKLRY